MTQFEVRFDEEQNVVHTVVEGPLDSASAQRISTETRALAAEHRCNILYDITAAPAAQATGEIYELPRFVSKLDHDHHPRVAVAVGQIGEDHRFYETAATNIGHTIRMFATLDEARAWLDQGQP